MKKISFLICFLFLFISCKNSFIYKLNDFAGYYEKSSIANPYQLPKSWNGWFELRIRRDADTIDGVEIRKFVLDTDLDFEVGKESEALYFYCYIAFIDDRRLVFYTPYRKKSKIRDQFNIHDPKQNHFQRGYYIYTPPSETDSLGQLKMLIENRKQKPRTELFFEVHYTETPDSTLKVTSLKLIKMDGKDDTQIGSDASKNLREYRAEDLFSFQPTYTLQENRSLKLFAEIKKNNQKGTKQVPVDSIYLDANNLQRFYYYQDTLKFSESIKTQESVRDTFRSW